MTSSTTTTSSSYGRFVRMLRRPPPITTTTSPRKHGTNQEDMVTTQEVKKEVEEEDKESLPHPMAMRVPWIPRLLMYRLPQEVSGGVGKLTVVQEAKAIGMDAASALVAEALDVKPGHDVLDLCCAPGIKNMAIAELMEKQGVLVGVDCANARLDVATSLMRKYRIANGEEDSSAAWNMVLVKADGTTFDPSNVNLVGDDDIWWSTSRDAVFFSRHDNRKRAGKKMRRALRTDAVEPQLPCGFDRVLVDAQCLHDASPRHQFDVTPQPTYKKPPPPHDAHALFELQSGLLRNGYRLLRPGGMLIYSTCSIDPHQNEDVVREFLATHPTAILQNPLLSPLELAKQVADESVMLPWTFYFSPLKSETSGMYVSKIMKSL